MAYYKYTAVYLAFQAKKIRESLESPLSLSSRPRNRRLDDVLCFFWKLCLPVHVCLFYLVFFIQWRFLLFLSIVYSIRIFFCVPLNCLRFYIQRGNFKYWTKTICVWLLNILQSLSNKSINADFRIPVDCSVVFRFPKHGT